MMDIPDTAPPRIVNLPETSIIVISHSQTATCPNCLVPVVFAVAQVDRLTASACPLPAQLAPSIIAPPLGFNLNN